MEDNNRIKPLEHQIQTIRNLDEQFKNNINKSIVVLPSGSGKTHTIAFHVASLKPKSFLYVVHRNEILAQTVRIFREVCGLKFEQIGIINQDHKQFTAPYTFTTIQTLSRDRNLEQMDRDVEYMVIDEYHHAAANSYAKVLDHFNPKHFVGLTATPYRLDGKDIMDYIDSNITNEIDLFEGIDRDILVPFHYVGLFDNIDYTKIKFSGYSYNVSDLDRKLIIHKRDNEVVNEYFGRIKPESRLTIAFCNSVNHVNRITSRFIREGVRAVGITHKEKPETRRQILADFKRGMYDIMFTRDILNEGVDFPECTALMFLRPTISKTIFFQQLGRGLRKMEGKANVLVLDFIGNYVRAFEKRQWLFQYKQGTTGENIKPEYKYNPNIRVEFDSRVIDMMDIQQRFHRDYNITREQILQDYLNTCRLEGKPFLHAKQYQASPHKQFSLSTIQRAYGSFTEFIRENSDMVRDYDFAHYCEPETHSCTDKQKLIDNYHEVKKVWKKDGNNKNRYRKTMSECVPSTFIDNQKVSRYSTQSYRKTFGTYRRFLGEIGEIAANNTDYTLSRDDLKRVHLEEIRRTINDIQKKLGRDYITASDWRKHYRAFAKQYITSIGGFGQFRKLFGIPETNTMVCVVCGKTFTSKFTSHKHLVCSDICRGRETYKKIKKPRKLAIREQKLRETTTCVQCGKTIPKYTSNYLVRKYCGKRCNGMHKYTMRKQEGKKCQS